MGKAPNLAKTLSKALVLLRQYHRLRQNVLARRLGIAASYLSEIEHGVKVPTLALLSKYSKAFHLPVSSILLFSEQLALPIHAPGLDAKVTRLLDWYSVSATN